MVRRHRRPRTLRPLVVAHTREPLRYAGRHSPFAGPAQRLAVLLLVADRGVAAHHGHVANLALARVPKRAIGTRAVLVAVQRARLAGDEEDHWVPGGGADTTLPLATVGAVKLDPSVQ